MQRDERIIRLSREHHHALVMALRIERELPQADVTQMQVLYGDLVRFWIAGLLPHFGAENECLLARIAQRDDPGLQLAGRLQREHREMEDLVGAMATAKTADDRRDALAEFGRSLREHIHWEERELFEWMQRELTEEEMDAIGSYLASHLPEEPVACPMPHDP